VWAQDVDGNIIEGDGVVVSYEELIASLDEEDAILLCIDPNVLSDIRRQDVHETMREWPIDLDSLAKHVVDGAAENAHCNSGVPDDLSDWDGPGQMCDVYLDGSASKLPGGMMMSLYAKVEERVAERAANIQSEQKESTRSVASIFADRVAKAEMKQAEPKAPAKGIKDTF